MDDFIISKVGVVHIAKQRKSDEISHHLRE